MATIDLTIPGLASQVSTQATRWTEYINQQKDWLAGTADGGPNSDGKYPLTNGMGLTLLVASPAKLADSVSSPAIAAQVAAAAAQLAQSIAETHAASAEDAAAIAEAAKVAVLSSVADSQAAAVAAQGHAANAATSASTAAGHANGLANAVATLNTNTGNLANAVSAQTALSTLVTDSRAEVSAKALTVASQANAVALANSTVTADKAIILTAKTDTLGYRDTASGHASNAAISLANTITARDLTLGYKNAAQTSADDAAYSALLAASNEGMSGSYASMASVSASEADAARVLAEAARDSAAEIVGGDFVTIGSKASKIEAEAGVSDVRWMTPARTKDAILALAGAGTEQFSVSVTATGSSQTVNLGADVVASELLIFENGLEQDAADFTKSGNSWTFTRPAGSKIRFMLAGGYRGRDFKPDVIAPFANRSDYDEAAANFIFLSTEGNFYLKTGSGWSDAIPLTGPQGPKGDQGIQGIQGVKGDTGLQGNVGSITYGTTTTALATASSAGVAASASRSDHAHIFPLATVSQTMTGTGSLSASDHGQIVEWNAASAGITLPANLGVGFNCLVRVIHATGIPTFTAASGATIRQADGLTKGRKQWSEISVSVRANVGGTAAEYVLSGDMS